jgi:hypothetical protein
LGRLDCSSNTTVSNSRSEAFGGVEYDESSVDAAIDRVIAEELKSAHDRVQKADLAAKTQAVRAQTLREQLDNLEQRLGSR